jgi:hypothetical protein
VDRLELARVVSERMEELAKLGITQADVAAKARCGSSTIRNMQYGKGSSHYSNGLLTRVSVALDLPSECLVKAFYPAARGELAAPSDDEIVTRKVMAQFAPYLAKIDAIPELQRDVAAIKASLNGVVDAIHEVNHRLAVVVDTTRAHSTELPGKRQRTPTPWPPAWCRRHIAGDPLIGDARRQG